MRYWDSSALVYLLVDQPQTRSVEALFDEDRAIVVWWGTDTECASAVARLERRGHLSPEATDDAYRRLAELRSVWGEIQPGEELREMARRLLRVHALRAGDALQLAAGWLAAEHHPSTLEFVCLDKTLARAASREGFIVITS